jgi:hypothetical protein
MAGSIRKFYGQIRDLNRKTPIWFFFVLRQMRIESQGNTPYPASLSGRAIMIRPALITSLLVLSLVVPVNHASAQVGDANTKALDHKVSSPTKLAFMSGMEIDEACWRSEQRLFCTAEKVQYVQCGCPSSMINHCTTDNDNPAHPACSGYCLDSEENKHPCEQNTLNGPPKDPP